MRFDLYVDFSMAIPKYSIPTSPRSQTLGKLQGLDGSLTLLAMDVVGSNEAPVKVERKRIVVSVCWILGFQSLVSWNTVLTIADYYYA
ncbi:putative equilibrative nucleoside transporter [Helianthus annuus]|uniref:Equilibrative nucleoside transporter n=1 Tax=Helianthus annuus TaxID=4232 RepID=A0A9K3DN32_HELAN|nr:putative equilibrative nucleoside transporter [Helianthus annuus]